MTNAQYIPHCFDIGKIRQALTTGDASQREYALKLMDQWKRPSGVTVDGKDVPLEAVYDDYSCKEMQKWGCD